MNSEAEEGRPRRMRVVGVEMTRTWVISAAKTSGGGREAQVSRTKSS